MTIEQIIELLNKLPESEKKLQLYACDKEGNNYPIESISLYDTDAKHSKENPLGLNYL